LSEFTDSGHITTLTISGMMMIGVSVACSVGDMIVGVKKHDLLVVLFLLRLIISRGVLSVTALVGVVLISDVNLGSCW
jgi:hypothetical protein